MRRVPASYLQDLYNEIFFLIFELYNILLLTKFQIAVF